jgi:hypothetical protein
MAVAGFLQHQYVGVLVQNPLGRRAGRAVAIPEIELNQSHGLRPQWDGPLAQAGYGVWAHQRRPDKQGRQRQACGGPAEARDCLDGDRR